MITGVTVDQVWSGPPVGAIEFKASGDRQQRKLTVSRLLQSAPCIGAHLPSYLPASLITEERRLTGDDEQLLDHFTVHVTRHTPFEDWRRYSEGSKCRVLYENHNQDWHPTDAGWCWPQEFAPLMDAGGEICLDIGHILYASRFHARSENEWVDIASQAFDGFLDLSIAACHLHTMEHFQGDDHQLDGFDILPWVRRVIDKHPNVILLVETGHARYSDADRLAALERWTERK